VPPPPPGSGDQYVALGDSYTAGPLIPTQLSDPAGCLRSDHNYPHLAAPSLATARFRDVSCSGARTDHMTEAQDVSPGPNPPQFDALDSQTTAVTVGIGGNDIGFTDIAQSCMALLPFGSPCRDQYVVNGVDEISRRISEAAPKIAAVIQGIRERAPAATIYVVNYLPIFPEGPLSPGAPEGCWPQMPYAYNDVPICATSTGNSTACSQPRQRPMAPCSSMRTPPASAMTPAGRRRSDGSSRYSDIAGGAAAPERRGMQGTATVLVAAIGAG
jgi:lysophospholipase L1-like esterase